MLVFGGMTFDPNHHIAIVDCIPRQSPTNPNVVLTKLQCQGREPLLGNRFWITVIQEDEGAPSYVQVSQLVTTGNGYSLHLELPWDQRPSDDAHLYWGLTYRCRVKTYGADRQMPEMYMPSIEYEGATGSLSYMQAIDRGTAIRSLVRLMRTQLPGMLSIEQGAHVYSMRKHYTRHQLDEAIADIEHDSSGLVE